MKLEARRKWAARYFSRVAVVASVPVIVLYLMYVSYWIGWGEDDIELFGTMNALERFGLIALGIIAASAVVLGGFYLALGYSRYLSGSDMGWLRGNRLWWLSLTYNMLLIPLDFLADPAAFLFLVGFPILGAAVSVYCLEL